MSNIHGLNNVLELPSFLLNKYKKAKDCFRENQPLLTGYLKHQTQLIAKGKSVLGVLDLSSQAESTSSQRQYLPQAVIDCCHSRQEDNMRSSEVHKHRVDDPSRVLHRLTLVQETSREIVPKE